MERGGTCYALVFFLLLGIVDSFLTYVGVNYLGLVEANVLINFLIQSGWGVFFVFKVVVYGFLAMLSLSFNHYPLAPLITFFGAGVVTWNTLMILLTF